MNTDHRKQDQEIADKKARIEANLKKQEEELQTVEFKHTINATVEDYAANYFNGVDATNAKPKIFGIPSDDTDLCELLFDMFKEQYLFHTESETWFYWDGTIWAEHNKKSIGDLLAKAGPIFLQKVQHQAAELVGEKSSDDDTQESPSKNYLKAVGKYQKKAKSGAGRSTLRRLCELEFNVEADHFDHDEAWTVLSDGRVIDAQNPSSAPLPASSKRPVARKMHLTLGLPDKTDGLWQRTLDLLVPDKEEQLFLQVEAGAAFVGLDDRCNNKSIPVLFGKRNTGKTTYTEILRQAFGSYGGGLTANALIDRKPNPNFSQDGARGLRFIQVEEAPTRNVDELFLKNLTGGGIVSTERKGLPDIKWRAQGVIHITSNHRLSMDMEEEALRKRINYVHFERVFDSTDPDYTPDLVDVLMNDSGSSILEWLIEGAQKYLDLGYIPVSDAMAQASDDSLEATSSTIRWIKSITTDSKFEASGYWLQIVGDGEVNKSDWARRADLRKNYEEWCKAHAEDEESKRKWSVAVKNFFGVQDFEKQAGYERLPFTVLVHNPSHGDLSGSCLECMIYRAN